MITRLEAHGHRCFPSLAIDLDRYHVLTGGNGAGKATLLDFPVLTGDMLRRQRIVGAFLEPTETQAGWWPADLPTPPRPKEALEHLKRRHRARVVNAEFGKLPTVMSVRQCQDPAFNQLRDHLRAWFPEQ